MAETRRPSRFLILWLCTSSITITCRRDQREHQPRAAAAVDNCAVVRQDIAFEDREVDWIQTELSTGQLRTCPADAEVPGRDLIDEPAQGAIERPPPHNGGNYCTT